MLLEEHTSKQFNAEIEDVRTRVLNMGGLVERQFGLAIDALKDGDSEIIDQVVANEVNVNTAQMEIDRLCSQIIARRQPTAVDLRFLVTVLHAVNDLERIGDEVKKMAVRARQIHASERFAPNRFYQQMTHLSEQARAMLVQALDAFARMDVKSAADIIGRDEQVDSEFQAIMRQLISYMMEDPRTITACLDIVFIAKSIERVGDHAKNLAEQVIHVVKGVDLRHAKADEIQREVQQVTPESHGTKNTGG